MIVFFNCAQILKKDAIERLLSDTLNFHPGILSQHRGLFPIFYAMLKKEKFIGFTLHRVERKIDSGKIFNEIKLPIEEKDGLVITSIHDNAGGIRIEPIEKVFDPFFTYEKVNGSGIGLFMSKLIIENNMGGKLEVKNKEDGALFIISIPKL